MSKVTVSQKSALCTYLLAPDTPSILSHVFLYISYKFQIPHCRRGKVGDLTEKFAPR